MAILPFSGGSPSARKKLNTMRESVEAIAKLRGDQFITVDRNSAGTSLKLNIDTVAARIPKVKGGSGSSVKIVTVTTIGDDTLTCDDGGTAVTVAKPYLLRKSTYNGVTRNGITYTYVNAQQRSATDGTSTRTEEVTFKYQAGDKIPVTQPDGGTGVTDVTWLDLSTRDWAALESGGGGLSAGQVTVGDANGNATDSGVNISDVSNAISKAHDKQHAIDDATSHTGFGNSVTKNVGTGAGDVAAGNHNHTGTYEPANSNIQAHIFNISNPHSTTAAQVGLGNVLNTAQEPALGNPASDGYVLSSTAAGVRSWISTANLGSKHWRLRRGI